MTGEVSFTIYTPGERIQVSLKRKYNVFPGKTGTGKSYIWKVLSLALKKDEKSKSNPVTLKNDVPIYLINSINDLEKACLGGKPEGICILDEPEGMTEREIAEYTLKAPHYYMIITREAIEALPYSVHAVFELRLRKGRNADNLTATELYSFDTRIDFEPKIIITEDSNSGYQFFKHVFKDAEVISANGKSNISRLLNTLIVQGKTDILVVADGAAFGSNVKALFETLSQANVYDAARVCIYLPESFEWLVLSSDIFRKFNLKDKLEHTENYAESAIYKSWETYYTELLVDLSRQYNHVYRKSKLSEFYLSQSDKIIQVARRDM